MKKLRFEQIAIVLIIMVVVAGVISPVFSAEQILSENGSNEVRQRINTTNQTGTVLNPTEANAAVNVGQISPYDTTCNEGTCEGNRPEWLSGGFALDVGANTGLLVATGKSLEAVAADPANTMIVNAEYNQAMMNNGILPGGLAGLTAAGYHAIETNPPIPTDLAFFINDIAEDTMFGGTVYAADPLEGSMFRNLVFEVWKVSRNLAIMLMGILAAVAALMVIFRKKISPQAVVTIYNVLPRLPIVLVLILLSYPIAAFLISLVEPLIYFAKDIAAEIGSALFPGSFLQALASTLVLAGINVFLGTLLGGGIMSLIVILISVATIIIFLIVVIIVLLNIIRAYVSMMINVMVAPFVFLMAILPGKEVAAVNLLKKMFIDILSVPLMLFILMLGVIIFVGPLTLFEGPDDHSTIFEVGQSIINVEITFVVKSVVSIMIMWQAVKVKKMLEGLMGVTGLFSSGEQKR